jgi:glycine cleavage system aminomethyltransferase T
VRIIDAEVPDALAERLRTAGAVMVARNGRAVAAHYGSAASELTVCLRRVGLAVRHDLDTVDLVAEPLVLDELLGRELPGGAPEPGTAIPTAGGWCCRLGPDHAIVAVRTRAAGSWRRMAGDAGAAGRHMRFTQGQTARVVLSVVGPRALRLMAEAGLPADLVSGRVRVAGLAAAPVLVICEAEDRILVVVPEVEAASVWTGLVAAGSELGVAFVGADALDRLALARDGALLHA